jgi:hypothetical protein
MSKEHDESRSWFESKIQGASTEAWDKAAKKAYSRRDVQALARKGKVFNMGELVDENPEYVALAKNTKKLREQLKAYSGSSELASDLLFQSKKEADEKGKDFGIVAKEKVNEMKGYDIVGPEIQFKPVEPVKKKSLAGRLAHKLWKMGLPIGMLLNLDVEEADRK